MPARFLHQVGVHLISCKMHTSRVMWHDDRKIPSRQFVIFWLTTALFSSQQVTSLIQAMSFVNFLVVLNLQLFCLTPIHQTSDNCRNSQFFRYTAIISLFIACTISLWGQIWGWDVDRREGGIKAMIAISSAVCCHLLPPSPSSDSESGSNFSWNRRRHPRLSGHGMLDVGEGRAEGEEKLHYESSSLCYFDEHYFSQWLFLRLIFS